MGTEQYAFAMLDQNGSYTQYGLTKREYFAGIAMQGLLSNPRIAENMGKTDLTEDKQVVIAKMALVNADALIEALNKD